VCVDLGVYPFPPQQGVNVRVYSFPIRDVAVQPMWRNIKYRHRSCDDTCSFATNLKKYYYLFTFVAKLHVSSQLRWRPLTYRHRGCRATSQCAFKFLVANVTYKMTPRFFPPKR
jgi:hypothetical protein